MSFNPRARVSATAPILQAGPPLRAFQSTRSCERDVLSRADLSQQPWFQSTRSCERDFTLACSSAIFLPFQSTRSCERDQVSSERCDRGLWVSIHALV